MNVDTLLAAADSHPPCPRDSTDEKERPTSALPAMTLNDTGTLPPRPLTAEELEALDTTGWTRQTDEIQFGSIHWTMDRYPVTVNNGHWIDKTGQKWGNVTPQARFLTVIQVIFWKIQDGVKITQPVEVEPTEQELRNILDHQERRRTFHNKPSPIVRGSGVKA